MPHYSSAALCNVTGHESAMPPNCMPLDLPQA
jgi:hypothetical protein